MKNAMASAGLIAFGALGLQSFEASAQTTAAKPWNVSATLRGFYDDNYNTVTGTGPKQSSYGLEISPKASVKLEPDAQTMFSASFIYGAKYYEDRPSGKWDQSFDFELLLNHQFNERFGIDLNESLIISQEPEVIGASPTSPAATQVLRSNGNNLRNDAGFSLHYQVTKLLGLVLSYDNTYYDYSQTGNASYSATLDRDENHATLESRWQIEENTTGLLGYTFGAVLYTSGESLTLPPATATNPFPLAPDTRNSYSHTAYVGVQQNFTRTLVGVLKVGGVYLDNYNAPTPTTDTAPYADVSLNYTYNRGSVQLGYNHSFNQTDIVGAASATSFTQNQESGTVYGSVIHKLTPKLTGTLTGQYQHSVFKGGAANDFSEDFFLAGVNLNYQFVRWFSAEAGYNYTTLASEIGRGYNRNVVYAGITGSY